MWVGLQDQYDKIYKYCYFKAPSYLFAIVISGKAFSDITQHQFFYYDAYI